MFEFLLWYENRFPDWMTDEELTAAGYRIDKKYQPLISREALKDHLKETCYQYYERNFEVMQHVLNITGERGRLNGQHF